MAKHGRIIRAAILWAYCAIPPDCIFALSADYSSRCNTYSRRIDTKPAPVIPASHHLHHLVAAERIRNGEYDYDDCEIAPYIGRRRFMWSVALTSLVAGANVINSIPEPALAVETDTIWKTGRAPIVPGQKPRDKDDVKGTRKDPNFLRSVADCKGKCENTPGSDGLARTKEECLTTCQDICCTTYEQCTFAIVPR